MTALTQPGIDAKSGSKTSGDCSPIRVMVVDDSAVIRGLTIRILSEHPDIDVVASVGNGKQALNRMQNERIDVVLLDIEMPIMDGLTALPLMLKANPDAKIIMASSLTQPNARVSLAALRAGAADYVPKPSTTVKLSADSFKVELVQKIKALGRKSAPSQPVSAGIAKAKDATPRKAENGVISLRPPSLERPKALAVGSSTGGPNALFAFLSGLDPKIGVPIFVTQHMPPTFTKILAEHLTDSTHWTCHEAKQGQIVKPGEIYLAPGDFHMTLVKAGQTIELNLDSGPKENFCRPAVDPMLRSIIEVYGRAVITTILTGMGGDGLSSCGKLVAAGGTVVAQDEATSVVWGMPGAVAREGLCSAVLPLDQLASYVNRRIRGTES